MIVKDEAPVIRRCLDSLRALIDYWVIVDTGSSDGTQDLIRAHLKDVPGELHQRPWRDFAHNRSEALALARSHGDYTLIIDADDTLELAPNWRLPLLRADAYTVDIFDAGTRYQRPQLVRNTLPWRYQGVLHEYLVCEGAQPAEHLPIIMRRNHDGARRRDPQTYRKDAAVLARALATETDPFLASRYTFYLAQSYRDCGANAEAVDLYLRRAELGYWAQEVYVSLYQAAKLKLQLGHAADEIIALCLRASDLLPGRAEALHCASALCRNLGRNQQGYEIAGRGLALTVPADGLFVEPWIYHYGLLDEYAVNAYWSGHYRDSLTAGMRLLGDPACPPEHRARFAANARFALDQLPQDRPLAAATALGRGAGAHGLAPARALHAPSVDDTAPRVLLAILAKQQEPMLPLYLKCIEALDYPKSSIVIYIRTNNNRDRTRELLGEWIERVRPLYAAIEMDDADVPERVETYAVHEWNAERFKVLAQIRNRSLEKTLEHACAWYFTADVDNFLRPCTLKELVALSLPIVAPLLRSVDPNSRYSNFHADIDANGYFRDCQQYEWILSQAITGVFELPVVHCTYLIRADVIPALNYQDGSPRHEYVIFSDCARRHGISQYYDNRQLYGYLTLDASAESAAQAARLLAVELDRDATAARSDARSDGMARIQQKFSTIYRNNEWGYGSGVGSLPDNNTGYMQFVAAFMREHAIGSVLDFGCGDWQFSRLIDWRGIRYLGLDLVPEVIAANRQAYARDGVDFAVFNGLDDVPDVDLLLCKDVFQHLPNAIIRDYLAVFKQRARFLLITNDDQPDDALNSVIEAGGWRPVRLDHPPFSERAPIVFAWTVSAGGWKPTHKSTALIEGRCR